MGHFAIWQQWTKLKVMLIWMSRREMRTRCTAPELFACWISISDMRVAASVCSHDASTSFQKTRQRLRKCCNNFVSSASASFLCMWICVITTPPLHTTLQSQVAASLSTTICNLYIIQEYLLGIIWDCYCMFIEIQFYTETVWNKCWSCKVLSCNYI